MRINSKNQIYIILISLSILLFSPEAIAQSIWGSGTESDPYNIDADFTGGHTWSNTSYGTAGQTTYFKMANSCSIEGPIQTFNVGEGTVVFDLNGYQLTLTEAGKNVPVFNVSKDATLIIRSTGGNGANGKIVGLNGTTWSYQAVSVSGTFNFEGGTISGFISPIQSIVEGVGGAVIVKSTGIMEINGGTITNSGFDLSYHYGSGGGLISSDINHKGGGIYVEAGGTLRFLQGEISACTAFKGGAIYMEAPGTISGISVGQGLYISENSNISNCEASYQGGGVYVGAGGIFQLSGGKISDCKSLMGGGVYMAAPAVDADVEEGKGFVMTGNAEILNCIATSRGGGVYIGGKDGSIKARNRFIMEGGRIHGCKAALAGCGVLSRGYMKMIKGEISGNKPIMEYKTDGSGLPDYSQAIILDDGYPLGGGVCIQGELTEEYAYIPIAGVEFEMIGGTITDNVSGSGGGIMMYYNTTLKLSTGGHIAPKISGNHAIGKGGPGNGGGIYIQSSKFDFESGEISGNYARRYGGGINLNADAGETTTLNLNGNCKIIDNFAGHGGGISQEEGKCQMNITSKDVMILRNTARGVKDNNPEQGSYGDFPDGGNGGGIFMEKGELNISNGSIKNNNAGANGGGISLRGKRIGGEIVLNITGGTISYNNVDQVNPENGGGIDIFAESNIVSGVEQIINVEANILSGNITYNKSVDGAGINISTDEKCSAVLNIGEKSTSLYSNPPLITSNDATGNGGGITLKNGNINIYEGLITDNKASNGGGICLEHGTISVEGSSSTISNNIATDKGGGLYVVNKSTGVSEKESVSFLGGLLTNNTATIGGGVCVHGNINLDTENTSLKNNIAVNGGGVYLFNDGLGSTSMSYQGGLISGNVAESNTASQSTAYNNDANNKGVGGGVYLAEGTSLTLDVSDNLGLYGNTATTAADDIFTNGIATSLVLPDVGSMHLQDFDVIASELYWVEDYVTGDTEYNNHGTKADGEQTAANIQRYQTALKNNNLEGIHKIKFGSSETSRTYEDKYVCLALGYDLYRVSLIKKGLNIDESAIFNIYYKKGSEWIKYITAAFPCVNQAQVGNGGVKAVVVLPAGDWKIVEDKNWSWKYQLSDIVKDFDNNDIPIGQISDLSPSSHGILINSTTYNPAKPFTYTFMNNLSVTSVPSDEDVVINILSK